MCRHVMKVSRTLEELPVYLSMTTHTSSVLLDYSSVLTKIWLGETISETTVPRIATRSLLKKSL